METTDSDTSEQIAADDAVDSSVGRLAIGASVSLIGVTTGRGLEFAKQVAMARLLGPDAYGLFALGWNLLQIIGVLAPLGLHNGAMHFASRFRHRDDGAFKSIVVRSVLISFGIGWLLAAALWLLAPWITASLFKEPEFLPLFRVFTLVLPFMSALRVAAFTSRISQRVQYALIAEEIAVTGVGLLLFLLLYFLGWGLAGAIVSTVAGFVVALALVVYYLYRLFGRELSAQMRHVVSTSELLRYSLPTSFSGMFGVIMNRLDRIVLGFYWSAADVGVYQAAAQISVVMALVLNSFNTILTPMIADQFHRGQLTHLEELFRINTKWGVYFVLPVVLLIMIAADDIMIVLYGEAYASGAMALRILALGQFVNIASGASGYMLMLTGNETVWFRLTMVMVGVNLVLNFTLTPRFGSTGAAVATSLSIALLFSTGLLLVRRILGIWPYDRRYLKGLSAAAIAAVAMLLIQALGLEPLPNLLVTTAVAGLVYIGVLWMQGLDQEDRVFLGQIRIKLRRS